MKATTQLPPSEREAFEAFAQNCPMGKYSIARRGDGYDSSHTQLMWDAWQARAQVQGEPSWWMRETDEGAEWTDTAPLVLSGWTPLYTTPQPAQATQAELTDEQIKEAAIKAVKDGKLSWLGFEKDDQDKYTIPVISKSHYQFARAILALRPERVPMTDEQRRLAFLASRAGHGHTAFMLGIQFAEAHHGITAQAKKEQA